MLAARFHAAGQPLSLDDVPMRGPGPDEVRVRIQAAGVCGTELHFPHGLYAPARVPMTLGHEVAGTVDAVGSQVSGWGEGDRVAVYYYLFSAVCVDGALPHPRPVLHDAGYTPHFGHGPSRAVCSMSTFTVDLDGPVEQPQLPASTQRQRVR